MIKFLPKMTDDTRIYFNLFFSLIKQFKFEEAIIECKKYKIYFPEIVFNNLGVIYHNKKKYTLMEKYYKKAIEYNNSDAINNLGYYHETVTKSHDDAIEHYLRAANFGNSIAMNNIAIYHKNITQKYDLMKKYFKMAIKLNNPVAMNNYGLYHYYFTQKYKTAKKYFLMAIELNFCKSMNSLGVYYTDIAKKYDLAEKYYKMCIECNIDESITALNNLCRLYHTNKNYVGVLKCLKKAYELDNHKHELVLKKYIELYGQYIVADYKTFLINNNLIKNNCEDECLICLDTINVIQLECKHHICIGCITKVSKCVYCDKKFVDFILSHDLFRYN